MLSDPVPIAVEAVDAGLGRHPPPRYDAGSPRSAAAGRVAASSVGRNGLLSP